MFRSRLQGLSRFGDPMALKVLCAGFDDVWMDLLWRNLGRRGASNNLRQALHAAGKTLDPEAGSSYLASEVESLVLSSKGDLWVDADAFEEAAATAHRSRDPAAHLAAGRRTMREGEGPPCRRRSSTHTRCTWRG